MRRMLAVREEALVAGILFEAVAAGILSEAVAAGILFEEVPGAQGMRELET